MRIMEKFCGQYNGYSRSITLRNRLIPIGSTEEKLNEFLVKDKNRATAYPDIKVLIDEIHKRVIEQSLQSVKYDWEPLFIQFELYQDETDKAKKIILKKELETLQTLARRKIAKSFSQNPDFDKIFKDGLFKELLPQLIEKLPPDEAAKMSIALERFNRFSGYFLGYHENRKNMYSEEAKAMSIANRIVNENFPKYFSNIKLYNYLEKEYPEILSTTETTLKNYLGDRKLRDFFTINGFNNVLTQAGIDQYNTVIGGIALAEGQPMISGLNVQINLYRQQLPQDVNLNKKFIFLYKQILSDHESSSFVPTGFSSSREVYEAIDNFHIEVVRNSLSRIQEMFDAINEYNMEEIFVPAKMQAKFSQTLYGQYSRLSEGLFLLECDKARKSLSEAQEQKIRKEISRMDCNLEEIDRAYKRYCSEYNIIEFVSTRSYFNLLSMLQDVLDKFARIDFENLVDLQQEKQAALPIKAYLDKVQDLYHYIRLLDYRGDEQKDSAFYSRYDEIIDNLSQIVPLYNRTRNFVTKKYEEGKKIKLNFDCPTLANGWDENSESSNCAIILRRDGNYYLGILNPRNKPTLPKDDCVTNADLYEKMVYKLLPGPNKMLPKVFFSTKGKEKFCPPQDILDGYEAGRHKKGENFDIEFMRKLIDWFKSAILEHEDWSKFNFKFSPTASYQDMSGFYKEVEKQGYQITFRKIEVSVIENMIDCGQLFLFQIWNKDFQTNSKGKKNLHTLYWENLFSEENLRNVVLKLNGGAELFWKEASIKGNQIISHKEGSLLIHRTTKDGRSIPEDIYQEIYLFKNKKSNKALSDEARALLDAGQIQYKTARQEIIKDKHHTENMYLLHCPITMNFKSSDKSNREFNNSILEYLANNPDVKIIGLDRGERHLVYLSLINQRGEIELQKTLNLVNHHTKNNSIVQVNYREKLVSREKERDTARKNWQNIGNISQLKEGYLSSIIHEIAKLMIEHNAIIVMEDLNYEFKRERFSIERQVYQKFENMLIEKLNYLVFKDTPVCEPGGVLNAYQLTTKSTSVSDVYKQCGFLFYVPAAYTSKIDPITGFCNMFQFKALTNVIRRRHFFSNFYSVRYDKEEKCFAFGFDYDKIRLNPDYQKKWEVYTKGTRLTYNKEVGHTIEVDLTEELKKLLDDKEIDWITGENILGKILELPAEKINAKFYEQLLWIFSLTVQMRNYNQDEDYLLSPVKGKDGTFFDSRIEIAKGNDAKLPLCGAANGAYHIALKGLYLMKNDFNRNNKGVIQNIENEDWFKFLYNRLN